jgi:asparagine synthase (glutamine-hydrolysing)
MCGIVAFLQNSPAPVPWARAALTTLIHRGPDAEGEWQDGDVFLGHRRLSIIDLRTGQQPMHSSDDRYVIVFNGEIYNYRELRRELQATGAIFRTASDTEVILEGYRRWGGEVVTRLNGMFAFVIWDRVEHAAFGARDRLGIKPLCWAMKGDTFIVASTLEPFREIGGFDEFDPVAIRDLMTFDYIPAPRTIRRGVRKLEPGSRFYWKRGGREPLIETYWNPPAADRTIPPPSEEELEELLSRVVKRQMVSDVPIGVFLSGGIDSSLLVALMARQSTQPVKTYSVAFAEQEVDESPMAMAVARQFGTEHTVLRAEEIGAESLQHLIGSLDEPFCDPALVPLFALSRLTRAHVKVALSGDGGDEVFGGYEKYLLPHAKGRQLPFSSLMQRSLSSVPWRPRGMAHLYTHTMSAAERLKFTYSRYGDFPVFRKDLRQLLARDFQASAEPQNFFEPWERVARRYGAAVDADLLMRTDLQTYLSENCLVKTDRATMLASLEVRVPFLDELVLDRILPLPAEEKIVDAQLKTLLRPLATRLLPKIVWNRPKHGFNVPIEVKLASTWRPVVEDALGWGERHLAVFDYRYLRRLQRINVRERAVGLELWNPVMFITWAMSQQALQKAA